MRKSKLNYRVYNGKSFKKFFENSRIYILALSFTAGILTGAICLNTYEIKDYINICFDSYVISRTGQGITDIFLNSASSNILFFAVTIFFSFSLIGYTFIFWIPFLKGLGTGSVCGYLYSVYKFSGLGYSLLTVFPGAIVSTFALISACNNGCEYSKNAYMKAITGKGQFEKGETKIFLIRQFIFLCISIISSLVDAIFTSSFLRFFEF